MAPDQQLAELRHGHGGRRIEGKGALVRLGHPVPARRMSRKKNRGRSPPLPLVRMDRARTRVPGGGTRQNDGLETGMMEATVARLAWG